MNVVDTLSNHAAAPTAVGTIPTLTSAAQAFANAHAEAMLVEASPAAGKAELGTAVDHAEQGTIDNVPGTPEKKTKKRNSMSLEKLEPTTPKKARTLAQAKPTTPAEPKTPAKIKTPTTAQALATGDTTEEEIVTPAKTKRARTKGVLKKTIPNLDGNAEAESGTQVKTEEMATNGAAKPKIDTYINAKASESPKATQTPKNTSDDDVEAGPSTAPSTPPKFIAAKTPKTPRTPKTPKVATTNDEGVNKASPPRKRGPIKSPEGIAPPRGIPTSWETASEADRKLVEMKEAGKSWGEIRDMWKAVTGQTTADSTLPNRYCRIRVNLAHLESGHDVLLVAAIARYEHNKWQTIAQQLETDGGRKYTAAFLQKEFKKIEDAQVNSTLVPSTSAAATTTASDDEIGKNDEEFNGVGANENGSLNDEMTSP